MRTVRFLSVCICVALAWSAAQRVSAQGPMVVLPDPVQPGVQPASPPGQPVSPNPIMAKLLALTHLPVSYTADAPVATPTGPAMPTTPQAPGRPAPADMAAPPAAAPAFAEAAPAGTEAAGGAFAPQMLGDSVSYFSKVNFGGIISPPSPGFPQAPNVFIPAPALAGSAFKIADNESPLPQDRAFLDVNYFTAVFHSVRPKTFPQLRFTRTLLGFEKTFLGGDASFGIRVPTFELNDNAGGSSGAVLGDVTLISKFALLRDSASGWTVTGGLAVTVPTGPALSAVQFFTPAGGFATPTSVTVVNPTIVQPYVGFYYNPSDRFYVHGFSSMAIASTDEVPTVWFNDLAAGWYAYRTSCCEIIPTVEMHLTDGLSHRGSQSYPVGVIDTLDTILGVHCVWHDGTVLTFGYGFPWTGPQPFASELICQLNHRF